MSLRRIALALIVGTFAMTFEPSAVDRLAVGPSAVGSLVSRHPMVGVASWYGGRFHHRSTANGEIFDRHKLTAASPNLPLPSIIRVTNLDNGRSLVLRVNDRGPYVPGRVLDVSERAARQLGFARQGLATVRIEFASR